MLDNKAVNTPPSAYGRHYETHNQQSGLPKKMVIYEMQQMQQMQLNENLQTKATECDHTWNVSDFAPKGIPSWTKRKPQKAIGKCLVDKSIKVLDEEDDDADEVVMVADILAEAAKQQDRAAVIEVSVSHVSLV